MICVAVTVMRIQSRTLLAAGSKTSIEQTKESTRCTQEEKAMLVSDLPRMSTGCILVCVGL